MEETWELTAVSRDLSNWFDLIIQNQIVAGVLNAVLAGVIFLLLFGVLIAIYGFLFEDVVPFKSDEVLDALSNEEIEQDIKNAALSTLSDDWAELNEIDVNSPELAFQEYSKLVKAAYESNKFIFNNRIVSERKLAKPRMPRQFIWLVSLFLVPSSIFAYSLALENVFSSDSSISRIELNELGQSGFEIPSLTALQGSVESITSVPVGELPKTAELIQQQITVVQTQLAQLAKENEEQMLNAAEVRAEALRIQKQNELLQQVNQQELDAITDILTQASNRQNFTFMIINIAVAIFLALIAFPRNSVVTEFFGKLRGSTIRTDSYKKLAINKYRAELLEESLRASKEASNKLQVTITNEK